MRKKAVIKDFRNAPPEADFPPEAIALTFHILLASLQKKRCEGGGYPFQNQQLKLYFTEKVMF